jgi:hypothetical protein
MPRIPLEPDLPGGMPEEPGSGIIVDKRPQPRAINPKDANIFTAEMLRRMGGKMKEPPMDLEDVPEPPPGKKYSASKSTAKVEKAAFAKGGSVGSASKRADGIAERGKTRGMIVACGGGYMKGKK